LFLRTTRADVAQAVDRDLFFNKINYVPHSAGQWSYHRSKARFKVPVCGRRYGKSTMAGRDLEPKLFIPGKDMYWIVGPTYDLGEKEFRVIWDDLIINMQLGRDKRVKKAYNKRSGEMYIQFPWGVRVEVRSAQYAETLVGEGLSGAIMSEAAKHRLETWERFIRPALSDKRGWATFPTTPEGHNWLYQLWLLGQNPDFPDFASWSFPSWENTVIYPGGRNDPEILLLEKTTAPEWFAQEVAADFSSFVGRIYSEFAEITNVKKVKYNPAWPTYISFDWGFTNPLAAIEFQVDPWDNIYVFREHYKKMQILEEHVLDIKSRENPPGYHLDLAFGDAADPEAAEYITRNLVACYAEPEAKQNWRQGVDLVKTFLKMRQVGSEVIDEYGTPLEMPKLFVDHSCTNLIREFVNYRAMEGTAAKNPREIAQGIDDHALDALRYGLVHLYELGVTSHLSDVYTPGLAQATTSEVLAVTGSRTDGGTFMRLDKEF
jgi:hypothetical protein